MAKKKETENREEQTLEEAFVQLDDLIEILEDKETSLEDSFQVYQKGMELIKKCSEKIAHVETKVLLMNEDGELDEF